MAYDGRGIDARMDDEIDLVGNPVRSEMGLGSLYGIGLDSDS